MTTLVTRIGLYRLVLKTNVVARIGFYRVALMTNVVARKGCMLHCMAQCHFTYRVV